MKSPTINRTDECTKCGACHSSDDVQVCHECRDIALCAECREDNSEVCAELSVCSEECAIAAISRMQSQIATLKRHNAEMANVLAQIKATEADLTRYAEAGTCYAYALGTAQGLAIYGLCWARKEGAAS
jgi:hypothetical protein